MMEPKTPPPPRLTYEDGTLVVWGAPTALTEAFPQALQWDNRIQAHRSLAHFYKDVALFCYTNKIPYQDEAKAFAPTPWPIAIPLTPRPYQTEALEAWKKAQGKGAVVLPTGAGKTILAMMCISHIQRPTLIHVPTIDLMRQWGQELGRFFKKPIGLVGDDHFDIQDITVITYASSIRKMSSLGNRFGLLIFDECHHLGALQTRRCAAASLAPYRLALTATLERPDGQEESLEPLIGPKVYEVGINDLEGSTLALYDAEVVEVEMTPDERAAYEEARALYKNFVRSQSIDMSQPNGFQKFMYTASRSAAGKEALKAWRTQRRLAQASVAKEDAIWDILTLHPKERALIFTDTNDLAYRLGMRFLLPVLTHRTSPKERQDFLEKFRSGHYRVLVTSKVLNEGVDVPEASLGIVVSGSGTVREHVQRLGRILRARPGKRAMLYEIISARTGESYVSQRRRQHSAYEKSYPYPQ